MRKIKHLPIRPSRGTSIVPRVLHAEYAYLPPPKCRWRCICLRNYKWLGYNEELVSWTNGPQTWLTYAQDPLPPRYLNVGQTVKSTNCWKMNKQATGNQHAVFQELYCFCGHCLVNVYEARVLDLGYGSGTIAPAPSHSGYWRRCEPMASISVGPF